jgi:DNA-directed RNA polymerase sigma subunit (sigma70/sigma32)
LSTARRRELAGLISAADGSTEEQVSALAHWLLRAVPVRTYLEIAETGSPCLRAIDPPTDDCCRRLIRRREELFLVNYGLAKAAAHYVGRQDYDDRVSAASSGLLDAIDRYVPGAQAARFGYFASYWIRYHLARQVQKSASLVSFPIHQHRLGRRIDHYLADRRAGGLAAPSEAKLRAELNLGSDAYYWHQRRPKMISLQSPGGSEPGSGTIEQLLCDPAPASGAVMDQSETLERFGELLRASVNPATRVMLAYVHGIGPLTEAAEDYLAQLHHMAVKQLHGAPGTRF